MLDPCSKMECNHKDVDFFLPVLGNTLHIRFPLVATTKKTTTMKYSCSRDKNIKCASCSLFFILLSAINLPFYDPQVTIRHHQMVDFLLQCYVFSRYTQEKEYKKIYCLHVRLFLAV